MPPTAETYRRAAGMRRALTPPEARLWTQIKGGGLEGLRFRRQHPVGPYILDFYCHAARLAVEVDGAGHDDPEQIAHDERRTLWLATQGVEVLRGGRGPSTATRSPSPLAWGGKTAVALDRSIVTA